MPAAWFDTNPILLMSAQPHAVIYDLIRKRMDSFSLPLTSSILVGVSGGADSMVLLYALHDLGYKVTAGHVNFKLRGEASDADAHFVVSWCNSHSIPVLVNEVDTRDYAELHQLNIQSAAREIRYSWWKDLVEQHGFAAVATGHHLDDHIETTLLNLLRGTGFKGLTGIPSQRDLYIRPMLDVTRSMIESYATTNGIPFRLDQSNESDAYQRNRLRHHLIPLLEKWSPGFPSSMRHSLHRMQIEWNTWAGTYAQWESASVQAATHGYTIRYQPYEMAFVLRWLEEQGFSWNLVHDYVMSDKPDTGNALTYEGYRLTRIDSGLHLENVREEKTFILNAPGRYEFESGTLTIGMDGDEPEPGKTSTVLIRSDVIQWPLEVRGVLPGDRFQPLGMRGHSKKLQDFMVDLKLEQYEKRQLLVLTNSVHILWVMGWRLDERARVSAPDQAACRMSFTPGGKI